MSNIVCFGEVLMRLSPPGAQRLRTATAFEVRFGGAEMNVAAALAGWGHRASLVTRVPSHELGEAALRAMRTEGIDTRHVARGGERLGVYFLEHGAAQRPSQVVYDRAHSAFGTWDPRDIDWQEVLADAGWLHLTGITPALGEALADAAIRGMDAARARGITVSFDLNYRKTLWSRERASEVIGTLCDRADLLVTNEEDAGTLFGLHPAAGEEGSSRFLPVARGLLERHPRSRTVAITMRENESASVNRWSAGVYEDGSWETGAVHRIHVVDRVGAGDAFAAGLIHATLAGYPLERRVRFATAASCLKHSMPGDILHASIAEVEALAGGEGHGRIVR